MDTPQIDLDAYLERIGYAGPRAPSLDTLRRLHELHPVAIPFENLSPFVGHEVPLDLPSIERKLVHDRRGGYCFEHNLLLLDVLRQLGFHASGLAARVLWNQPEHAITARGHMLLRVELDGTPYLVDVGFGGQTLTAPLRLDERTVQDTPHESFQVVDDDDCTLLLRSQIRGTWKTLYRFDLAPAFLADYEVTNYFLSTHPHSHFRTRLIAARVVPGRRFALSGAKLSVHPLVGESQVRELRNADDVIEVLEETFGIRTTGIPSLEDAVSRLLGNPH